MLTNYYYDGSISINMHSCLSSFYHDSRLDRVKRIWYLSPMRAAKVQASLRICAVSPEPSLLAHRSSESRGTFRQKARSLAPLNGWACAVKMCHDGMLEDTNSLDGAQTTAMRRPPISVWLFLSTFLPLILVQSEKHKQNMRLFTRKPICEGSDQVRLKPACSATETS